MDIGKFLKIFFAVALSAVFATSCSDDDNDGASPQGKTLSVRVNLNTDQDLSNFADAYVISYVNGETKAEQIQLGKEYTKQIEGTSPTDTVGFVVYLCTKPGVADGDYRGKYSLSYTAELTEGGKLKDKETVNLRDRTFKAAVDAAADASLQDLLVLHQFTVKKDMVVEVEGTSEFDDAVEEQRDLTPTVDADTPFTSGRLYHCGELSKTNDSQTLGDNLAARFGSSTRWNAAVLSHGDLLYLRGTDVSGVDKTALQQSADGGTVFFVDGADKTQLALFCDIIGTPCLITPDCHDDMFIIAKEAGGDTYSADPIFIRLSPHNTDGATLDDYNQGLELDMALRHVGEYLSGKARTAAPRRVAQRESEPEQVLNRLVSAYRVSLFLPQTVYRKDYRKKNLNGQGDSQTNLYEVNYSIWNVFNIDQKINFYYVHQELNAGFSPCCWPVYNKSVAGIAKVCEWYGRNVKTRLEPYNTIGMHIENSSPATTSGSTTFTSGISYGISGTVGYSSKQGAHASVTASLSFSSSTSYSVPDVIVYNRCLPGQKFEWEYDLADVTSSFSLFSTACTQLRPGAAPGRSTLVAGADYMFSFPESSGQPQMRATLEVLLRSSCSKCGVTCYVRDKKAERSDIFTLPYLTTADFQKK